MCPARLSALLCASFIISCARAPVTHEGQGEGDVLVPKRGIIKLFNGENLDGLYTWLGDTRREDPRRVFTVSGGMIRISGDGLGYLSTAKAYRDYRLVAEFRWGRRNWRDREQAARDSGIFLHSVGPDGNSFAAEGAFKAAIECQVMQGCVGDLMLIGGKDADGSPIPLGFTCEAASQRDRRGWLTWKRGGKRQVLQNAGVLDWFGKDAEWKDVLDYRGRNDVDSPVDRWTRVECVCDGGRITVIVNGTTVNEVRDATPRSGKILLQCEGSEIFFRRFELHPLSGAPQE